MFCLRCGSQNADTVDNCANCGEPLREPRSGEGGSYTPPHYGPPQTPYQYDNSQPLSNQSNIQQSYLGSYGTSPPKVPDHLLWAVLSTLIFCPPTGIVALVYATQVDGKLRSGDYEGAVQASISARTWSLVSVGLMAAVLIIYLILAIIAAVLG